MWSIWHFSTSKAHSLVVAVFPWNHSYLALSSFPLGCLHCLKWHREHLLREDQSGAIMLRMLCQMKPIFSSLQNCKVVAVENYIMQGCGNFVLLEWPVKFIWIWISTLITASICLRFYCLSAMPITCLIMLLPSFTFCENFVCLLALEKRKKGHVSSDDKVSDCHQ